MNILLFISLHLKEYQMNGFEFCELLKEPEKINYSILVNSTKTKEAKEQYLQ